MSATLSRRLFFTSLGLVLLAYVIDGAMHDAAAGQNVLGMALVISLLGVIVARVWNQERKHHQLVEALIALAWFVPTVLVGITIAVLIGGSGIR